MDPDLVFVIGLVLAVFSVPAIISAFSEGRAPRVAAFTVISAGVMVIWAIQTKPGGYAFSDIPKIVVQVVAEYLT